MALISDDIVILTRADLDKRMNEAFQRGVRRGRFEESCDRGRNSARPGKVAHSETTESTGAVSSDAAVRLANSLDDPSHPWTI
jgi:hypothetical protein